MFKKKERGFTLIELLAVIAILGVLSGLAVPRVVGALENARRNRNVANAAILQSAVDRYFVDRGTYPIGTALGGEALPTGLLLKVLNATELANYLQRGVPPVAPADMLPDVVAGGDVVATSRWGVDNRGIVLILRPGIGLTDPEDVQWRPSP